jgi:hypothetical protein
MPYALATSPIIKYSLGLISKDKMACLKAWKTLSVRVKPSFFGNGGRDISPLSTNIESSSLGSSSMGV